MDKKLTKANLRRRKFAELIHADPKMSATDAAIQAGYAEGSAKVTASKLLKRPEVQEYLDELAGKQQEKTVIEADSILKRLDYVGDVDPADIYDANGNLRHVKDMPMSVRKSIKSIKVRRVTTRNNDDEKVEEEHITVEFWNKNEANALLGKNMRLFTDRLEIQNDAGLAQIVRERQEARDRGIDQG